MTTPDSLVETLAAQWDGCEYDAPGGLIDIGDAIRRAGLPLEATPGSFADRNLVRQYIQQSPQAAPGQAELSVAKMRDLVKAVGVLTEKWDREVTLTWNQLRGLLAAATQPQQAKESGNA